MAFLKRLFKNKQLQNLSRDPVARIEPIAPPIRPPFSIPQTPVLPTEEPILSFDRLPVRPLREDFLSIERLNNVPKIRPIISEPTLPGMPSVIPEPTLPELPVQVPPKEFIEEAVVPEPTLPGPPPVIPEPTLPGMPPVIPEPSLPGLPPIVPEPGLLDMPPITPRIPIEPPSIGGLGGINQDFRPLEQKGDQLFISRLDDPVMKQLPTGPNVPFVPPASEPVITPDSNIESAPTTPAAVASDVGAVPVASIPQDVRGQVDPVLAQQDTQEILTDPLLRALYFGTADQPGFINQLQQATANLIASDVPLQQTAGLSELEQIAQDRALADLGVAEPFIGESADLIRGTTRQFDPNMTQQFFNPFEEQVVQQTIQDVLEAGEKRDIQQRARDIQTGGLSAFGSRARLTAADRQEALGRGLAEALGGIRQAGFGQAQRDALSTFAQQRQAEQQAARDLGQVGSSLADLRARERAGLAGFGQTGRGIQETIFSRLFQQQLDQQGRPLQALQLTGQLLPQFQAGRTQIDSQYRLPTDPSAAGLGAAFNTYAALAPKQGAG